MTTNPVYNLVLHNSFPSQFSEGCLPGVFIFQRMCAFADFTTSQVTCYEAIITAFVSADFAAIAAFLVFAVFDSFLFWFLWLRFLRCRRCFFLFWIWKLMVKFVVQFPPACRGTGNLSFQSLQKCSSTKFAYCYF